MNDRAQAQPAPMVKFTIPLVWVLTVSIVAGLVRDYGLQTVPGFAAAIALGLLVIVAVWGLYRWWSA